MNEKRRGYGFTNEGKEYIRYRASGWCEFPGEECENSNTGTVNHITGCYEARLSNKLKDHLVVFKDDKSSVCDIETNAIMLCETHEAQHDIQEDEQIELLAGLEYRVKRR